MTLSKAGTTIAKGVIIDDDTVPTISIADLPNVVGGTDAVFVVTLSNPSGQAVTFDWATGEVGDTATADVDFVSASGSATIGAGSTSYTLLPITTIADPELKLENGYPLNGMLGTAIVKSLVFNGDGDLFIGGLFTLCAGSISPF